MRRARAFIANRVNRLWRRLILEPLVKREMARISAQFPLRKPSVMVDDKMVRVAAFTTRIRWSLLPHVEIRPETVAKRSLSQLFAALTAGSIDPVCDDLAARLIISFKENTDMLFDTQAFRHALDIWSQTIERALAEALKQYEHGPQNDAGRRALEILRQSVDAALANFRQEVIGGVDRIVNACVYYLGDRLREISASFSHQLPMMNHRAIIYPRNTIYCAQKGNVTVAVVADDPQVRTVFMSETLLADRPANTDLASVARNGLRLAIPHMVYVVTVADGQVASFQVFYSKGVPTASAAPLYKCTLPNTHSGNLGGVCLGNPLYRSKDFADLVAEAIGFYWSTIFNGSVANLQAMAVKDSRVSSLWRWAQETKKNPRFATNVDWIPCGITLQDTVVNALTTTSKAPSARADAAINEALAAFHKGLLAELANYFKGLQTDNLFSRSIRRQFRAGLQGEAQALVELVRSKFSLENVSPAGDDSANRLEAVFYAAFATILADKIPQLKKDAQLELQRAFPEVLQYLSEQGEPE